MRIRVTTVFVALVAVALPAASAATAAGVAPTIAILAPAAPATVVFPPATGAQRTGMLAITLTASPRGAIRVAFVGTSNGIVATANGPARGGISLAVPSSELSVRANRPSVLELTFTLAPTTSAGALTGTVVVSLRRGASAALGVQGALATGPPPPQPAKVVVAATSWFPWWRGELYDTSTSIELPAKLITPATATLQADSGRKLQVTVADNGTNTPADELRPGEVSVDKVGGAGQYTGTVAWGVAPNASLPVTVHVRDFFLWPFLVLLIGAVAGGYGLMRYDQWRRPRLLLAQMNAALKGTAVTALDSGSKSAYDGATNAITLVTDDDSYADALDAVTKFEQRLTTWRRLDAARTFLAAPHSLAAGATGIVGDVKEVQARLAKPPQDDTLFATLAGDAERLAALVEEFTRVAALRDEVGSGRSPNSVYKLGAYLSVAGADSARRDLEILAGELRLAQPPHEHAPGLVADADVLEVGIVEKAVESAARPSGTSPHWQAFVAMTPAQLRHEVRSWDWIMATIVAAVTLLAFLLTKYNRDFGTLQDYAQVFAAGFLGQVGGAAIAWNLFPPFRSYRATRTTPPPVPAPAAGPTP